MTTIFDLIKDRQDAILKTQKKTQDVNGTILGQKNIQYSNTQKMFNDAIANIEKEVKAKIVTPITPASLRGGK